MPGGEHPGPAYGQFRPTVNQLATMLHVSLAYIAIARRMPAAKRAAILAGYDKTSFVGLLNAPKAPLALPAPKAVNGVDDVELQNLARNVGVGRWLDAAIAVEQAAH